MSVQSPAFHDSEGVVRQRITKFMQNPLCRYYLALFGAGSVGCEEPVGSLRLELDNEIGIYAFGIHPAYQGRGYGRQMAEEVIHQIYADQDIRHKTIMLDVETDNFRALSLYHSCGFQIRATYNYYNFYITS